MNEKIIIGVIPARYASTRLPRKPLTNIAGKSLISRVISGALSSKMLSEVIVATDNEDIFIEAESAGAKAVMTSEDLPSGSDRVLQAVQKLKYNPDYVINIQGDEVFITGEIIDTLADYVMRYSYDAATLIKRIINSEELINENIVKVALSKSAKAHYFSRAAIPFQRDDDISQWLNNHNYYKHIGIYAYKYEILSKFVKFEPSKNEKAEKLEQLRLLDNGIDIYCKEIESELLGIDTPEDVKKAEYIINNGY